MHNLLQRQAVFISSFVAKKNHLLEGHHSHRCQQSGEELNNKRKEKIPHKQWICDNFINLRIRRLFKMGGKYPTFQQNILDKIESRPQLIHHCLELAFMHLTLTITLFVKPGCQHKRNWFMEESAECASDHAPFRRLPSHSKGSIKTKWSRFLWISGSSMWNCYGLGKEAFNQRREKEAPGPSTNRPGMYVISCGM